jgi:hypothetical protein
VTLFIRLLERADKGEGLRETILAIREGSVPSGTFSLDPAIFRRIPTSPFAYTLASVAAPLFETLRPTQSDGRFVAEGLNSTDNFRFLRLWWEVGFPSRDEWVPLAKGGEYSRYYSDLALCINWRHSGAELRSLVEARYGSASKRVYGEQHYFKPGLTYSQRSQKGLSFRALPADAIFNVKGPIVVSGGNLLSLLATVNSTCYRALVELQTAFGSYNVGYLQRTPLPALSAETEHRLAELAKRLWSTRRSVDLGRETSHAFVIPTRLSPRHEPDTLPLNLEVDELVFAAYGIAPADQEHFFHLLDESVTSTSDGILGAGDVLPGDEDSEDEAIPETLGDATTLAADLVSWAAGIAFGRFDIRLATGARPLPPEPEPFDPLPACSPAMLTGDDGLPLARPPVGYPLGFPEDGILVEDPGHPRDLAAAVRAVFETVFGPQADAEWQRAAALLDPLGHDLRTWLAAGFFDHHLQRHSMSRRKAPILWQLGVPSGRFAVWCYAHRQTRDSLFVIQNDILSPKLTHEERRLASLITDAGVTPSARDRAEIATQEAIVDELRVLLHEVRRVASLWDPRQDDGMVLVLAPLWRLFPGHRAWQKELKFRWDELRSGKYDWAHVAMHLWPERVVPKCATDRSLAIAHGLEDVFWAEGPDGKWARRARPTRPVEELVAERTSPAVKAALADLQVAPAPAMAGRGRGRGS